MYEQKRTKTGGRKLGTPNRLTRTAREAFQFAFDELDGADGLVHWARDHQDEFYRLYSRLIPAEAPERASIQVIINNPRIAAALAKSAPPLDPHYRASLPPPDDNPSSE